MRLSSVTHDIPSNTLDVVWEDDLRDSEGNIVRSERVKCRTYSIDKELEDFLADVPDGDKYVTCTHGIIPTRTKDIPLDIEIGVL